MKITQKMNSCFSKQNQSESRRSPNSFVLNKNLNIQSLITNSSNKLQKYTKTFNNLSKKTKQDYSNRMTYVNPSDDFNGRKTDILNSEISTEFSSNLQTTSNSRRITCFMGSKSNKENYEEEIKCEILENPLETDIGEEDSENVKVSSTLSNGNLDYLIEGKLKNKIQNNKKYFKNTKPNSSKLKSLSFSKNNQFTKRKHLEIDLLNLKSTEELEYIFDKEGLKNDFTELGMKTKNLYYQIFNLQKTNEKLKNEMKKQENDLLKYNKENENLEKLIEKENKEYVVFFQLINYLQRNKERNDIDINEINEEDCETIFE